MPVSSLTLGKAKIDRIEFSPEEIEGLKRKLLKLTEATVIVRSPVRNKDGKLDYVEVPDTGIQLAATVKALEFGVGKPRQMMEVTTSNGRAMPEGQSLAKLLAGNPDIASKIITALKDGLENAQAIPVQEVKRELPSLKPESESGSHQR